MAAQFRLALWLCWVRSSHLFLSSTVFSNVHTQVVRTSFHVTLMFLVLYYCGPNEWVFRPRSSMIQLYLDVLVRLENRTYLSRLRCVWRSIQPFDENKINYLRSISFKCVKQKTTMQGWYWSQSFMHRKYSSHLNCSNCCFIIVSASLRAILFAVLNPPWLKTFCRFSPWL